VDRKTTTTRQTSEVADVSPTINHKIIKALIGEANGLGVLDIAQRTSLSIDAARQHVFSLMVAGIVCFEEGSLYQLTDSGRKLVEDLQL